MPRMARSDRELLGRRLAAQWIEPAGGPPPAGDATRGGGDRITTVVERLLAVQAQDFGQAVWALGVRAPGSRVAEVDAALDSAAVVRSWPIRGTLHFTTPDDLRWMLALTAAKTVRGMAARHRDLDLTDDDFVRASAVAGAELAGGGSASRTEFLELLEAGGVDTSGQRGMHLIWRLAHDGLVCWGPRRGTQQALVLLDEWAPPTRELSREEALGEFVLRYVIGRGPTTLADFCWWSKMTVADAKTGLSGVRDRLEVRDEGGTVHLAPPATTEAAGETGATGQHALPGFDEYLLGYRSRSPALAAEFTDRIVPGGNGIFLPTLVSRGAVVGTWKRRISASAATVTLEPFAPLSATEHRGLVRSLRGYADFLGLPLVLAPEPTT